jgi:multidrug efflux pump subunit AcrB
MWIVRLALTHPYTFVVMAMVIVLLGGVAVVRMPTDIFPEIDIPVASVIFSFGGIPPEEMERRVVTIAERAYTTAVADIEHIESQSLTGVGIIKMYFHPDAKIEAAIAQLSASSQSVLRVLPPGMFPPLILRYNAASVPILQLTLSSDKLSEQELFDYGANFVRTQLATVQGASVPLPYGGRYRQIMVDIDPKVLYAQNLSPYDVVNAINAQNLILPTGFAKFGTREYGVRMNSSPELLDALNDLPVKQVNNTTVYVRDVAHVRDGYAIQNNVVRENGKRSALITVLKTGSSSTLDIVARVRKMMPRIQATMPRELNIRFLFDQSLFVRAAVNGVLREAIIAAVLTGLMILLFLGSWRSTLIVCISIPLSILTSLGILYAMGQTINVMTLGGLALAVGILVDDATVTIENIHRNLAQQKPIIRAILDGAQQIAVPAFVSTLCICIVFVPVIFLSGTARYLFSPLALAVVLAMQASYLLSRTLVPTMVNYLLRSEIDRYRIPEGGEDTYAGGFFWKIHHGFQVLFERGRAGYARLLDAALAHRRLVLGCFLILFVACGALIPFVGTDFFPYVDAGQIRLHVRAPGGTRIEETEQRFARVEDTIRNVIPKEELSQILDDIGLPVSGYNIAFSDSGTIGAFDGEIMISLNKEKHGPTAEYIRRLRHELTRQYPDMTFFFQPADIVGEILNFGLPSPLDIQVSGPLMNGSKNLAVAREIERRVSRIPGAVDVHLHQVVNVPEMRLNVDRTKANQAGLTQRDVANSMLISLASSSQVAPNYWLSPVNGVQYSIAVQTPDYRMDSTDALLATPIRGPTSIQLLSNLAEVRRGSAPLVINHYNVQPVYDIYANVQDRDLGSVASEVDQVIRDVTPRVPRGSIIETCGQVQTMRSSFVGLGLGLIFAIVLVYFVMAVNFQSWLDPLVILMAVPGAISGIIVMLAATGTTINVPSLMGAIMSIGVGTANSILLVTFANDLRREDYDARRAALAAGHTRLRPVIMTAMAMVIGMLPMALGFGEGGEQNAPLGRAVIGGLLIATFATLFLVPVVYSLLRRKAPVMHDIEGI